MTKNDELLELGKSQTKEEKELREKYYKSHEKQHGYGCFEIPGMREISEKYRKRYGEILEKYKNE